MKFSGSLLLGCALALGGAWACSSSSPDDNGGGTGGDGGDSTGGTGGKATGGSVGSGTGGSVGTSGGSGGSSTGGSGGSSTGGSGGGGSGGSSTGADAGAGATGQDGGAKDGGGCADGAPATGKLTITVDGVMMMNRLCFKPEASNSGGNHSPKIDWTGVPPGTKSLALTMYDQTNMTPHRIVCNISPDITGQPADIGTMVFPGAQVSTGHNKPGNMWYGPGAGGNAHSYEIAIWALSTPMLEGGCNMSGAAPTRAVYNKLKTAPPTLVLASDAKVLWGNVDGKCFP